MKVCIRKASDLNYKEIITMNSMEELSNFIKKFGEIIVRKGDVYGNYNLSIIIYDDYIE
jgi:hypothetical protein|nr:MAG TPA: hypothetical protein [Caudoviricetes sp.]